MNTIHFDVPPELHARASCLVGTTHIAQYGTLKYPHIFTPAYRDALWVDGLDIHYDPSRFPSANTTIVPLLRRSVRSMDDFTDHQASVTIDGVRRDCPPTSMSVVTWIPAVGVVCGGEVLWDFVDLFTPKGSTIVPKFHHGALDLVGGSEGAWW